MVMKLLNGTDTNISLCLTAERGGHTWYNIMLEQKDGTALRLIPLSSFLRTTPTKSCSSQPDELID